MSINVDPKFSVFHLVERIQSGVNAVNHRRTMNLISYEIENATLIDRESTRIFSGFQRMSKFTPQITRYRKIAERAESVYVFGIPDVTPPEIPNINYVYLKPTDQLAKEWFIVSFGKGYSSVLATEELTQIDDPDTRRRFRGAWSFNLTLSLVLNQWLSSITDAPDMGITEQEHKKWRNEQVIKNSILRLAQRPIGEKKAAMEALVQTDIHHIIANHL